MSDQIPKQAIIDGEGVAVWEVELPQEQPLGVAKEAPDPQTHTTVTVYCPVTVGVNDDGEAYAYTFADHTHPAMSFPSDGKLFVDARTVRTRPPERAYRASKFGLQGPGEMVAPEDVPEGFR